MTSYFVVYISSHSSIYINTKQLSKIVSMETESVIFLTRDHPQIQVSS